MSQLDDPTHLSDREPDGEPGSDEDEPVARKGRRRTMWVLVAAVVLLVVPIASIAGYGAYVSHIVSTNLHQDNLLPALTPEQLKGGVSSSPTTAPGVTPVAGTGVNFLLVGSDAGVDRSGARADVIMLVHVPEDRHNVTLIHFPRDLYVDIAGHGQDKINASYAYGGAPLLVGTLQQLTGAHVDHVAVIGFDGFKTMTDAVGGVDVYVEESSNEAGYAFTKGTMHLGGAQALAFVRERHQLSEGDISRGRRQQAFLKALMLKVLSSDTLVNPIKLSNLVDAATRNLTVDQTLDIGKMEGLALSLRSIRGNDVRFITAPFSGFATTSAGADIDVVDVAKMAAMGQALADDKLDDWKG